MLKDRVWRRKVHTQTYWCMKGERQIFFMKMQKEIIQSKRWMIN